MLAYLRGLELPSEKTGLRGFLARQAIFNALEMEVNATARRDMAAFLAVMAAPVQDAMTRRRATQDIMDNLHMAAALSLIDMDSLRELHGKRDTRPVEKIHRILSHLGVVGKGASGIEEEEDDG